MFTKCGVKIIDLVQYRVFLEIKREYCGASARDAGFSLTPRRRGILSEAKGWKESEGFRRAAPSEFPYSLPEGPLQAVRDGAMPLRGRRFWGIGGAWKASFPIAPYTQKAG